MIGDLKPYPERKDSGVPWLGEVPKHWELRKVREVARVINGFPFDAARFSTSRGYPLIRIRDLNKGQTTTLYDGPFVDVAKIEPGEVLIGMDGDFNVGAWRGNGAALLNQRMCCVRSKELITERFLEYVLPSPLKEINDITWSTTVKHLASRQVERISFGLPPLPEQAAIVRFLDHADRKIRRYIRAKQKLIKLLEEQKQAIIHRAVTRGLDPNVRLKSTGVEWLGDVPEHWEIRKLRHCVSIGGGMTPSMEERRFWDGAIPWVTPKDMKRSVIGDSIMRVTEAAVDETSLRLLDAPAILMVVRGMILARRVPIAWTTAPVTVNQDMKALQPLRGVVAEFLAQQMDSAQEAFKPLIDEAGHGTRRLPTERWRDLLVALPPEGEQRTIVRHLEEATRTVVAATDRTRDEISLLREYRTRLIADVVSGKLDVREAAAHLPDEVKEPEPLDETDALTDAEDVTTDDLDAAAEVAVG